MPASDRRVVLVIGISRGTGRGLAAELLRRGWSVIGTLRSPQDGLEAQRAQDVEKRDMTRSTGPSCDNLVRI
jgi:NAD(P)-dependent dehydrogenase (short-subunit alcohol dehydrogenase family)